MGVVAEIARSMHEIDKELVHRQTSDPANNANVYPTKVELHFDGEPCGSLIYEDDIWWYRP
jgi:hypothetical protein